MAKELKLKIIEIKSLNQYLVKEVDSESAKHYLKMEEMLQNTYSDDDNCRSKEDIEVGSLVCVYINTETHNRRAPKKWVRGYVHKVLTSIGTYLYDVFLIDYGIKNMVKRADVRELRSHFSTEFVGQQTKTFHLSQIDLKPDVNTEENRKLVEELLLKTNKSLVLANITRETDTNLLGTIKLNDGSDLNQFFFEKSLANRVFDGEIRKPKTSPIFKNMIRLSNGVQQNDSRPQSSRENPVSDHSNESSFSSVSSTNISMSSEASNEVEILTNSSEEEVKNKAMNGLKSGGFEKLFTRIKRIKERQQMMTSNGETIANSSDRSESPIDYGMQYNSQRVEEEVDWPEPKYDSRAHKPLRPAGVNPPPHVMERIYTLNKAQKEATKFTDHFN